MQTDGDPALFQFGDFIVDMRRGCLREGAREIELRPKTFALLRHLLVNAGRLVPKEELIEAIWPNVIVTDDSLARCVSELRQAIGDAEQRVIKTVPKRGYLFAASLAGANDDRQAASRRWLGLAAAGTVVAVAIAGFATASHRADRERTLPATASIAVLPFADEPPRQGQDYFSDGIAQDLIGSLSRFSNLFVVAQGSSFKYRNQSLDDRTIGRELNVRYLLEGSVRRDANGMRLTAELVDSTSGGQLWAEDYVVEGTDAAAARDRLARRIATTFMAHLSQAEIERVLRRPSSPPAAYDLYLRGKAEIARANEGQRDERRVHLTQARAFLDRSIEIEPGYAAALTALSQTFMIGWCERISEEFHQPAVLERSLLLAQEAVASDHRSAEAHAQLAWVLHWTSRGDEAMSEFRQAMALNPNLADGRFGVMLARDGRPGEAIEFMQRAMRLDPYHDPALFVWLGVAHFLNGEDDKSLEMHHLALARTPENFWGADAWRAAAAARSGHDEEARLAAAQVLRNNPAFNVRTFVDRQRLARPSDSVALARALHEAGLP